MYLLSHIFLKIKQKQKSCGRVGEKNETVKGLRLLNNNNNNNIYTFSYIIPENGKWQERLKKFDLKRFAIALQLFFLEA